MRPLLTAALLFVIAAPVAAEDDLTVLKAGGDNPPPRMLRAHLLAEAQKAFDARRAAVADLKTTEDVQKRQKELRAKFVEALGGFPDKTPLNAHVVGNDKRDGYRVERVVYESRPDHHVTANLYLPEGKGPIPAVLMPIGHSANGKADASVQRGAILLAKNGLAALAYDPIGQGERRQLLDDKGRPVVSSSTSEHTMAGVGALLAGRNTASYRVWDGIRGLDYFGQRTTDLLAVVAKMAGESEDIRLIGVGSAGPAALHAAVLEPRIKRLTLEGALVSWSAVVRTPVSHDQLTNVVPGALAVYDLPDLAALAAPRPLTIRKPADPTGKPLARGAADDAYKPVQAAYAKAGAEKQFVAAEE